MYFNLSSIRGVLSSFCSLILADRQSLIDTHDALSKASEDDQEDWGCDFDVSRHSWGMRVVLYVDLARKAIEGELTGMEQSKLTDIANSLELMRECWNKTCFFFDDHMDFPDTTYILENISDTLLVRRSYPNSILATKVVSGAVANAAANSAAIVAADAVAGATTDTASDSVADAVAEAATGGIPGANERLGDGSLSPQFSGSMSSSPRFG